LAAFVQNGQAGIAFGGDVAVAAQGLGVGGRAMQGCDGGRDQSKVMVGTSFTHGPQNTFFHLALRMAWRGRIICW
jgi:hypothetical protein